MPHCDSTTYHRVSARESRIENRGSSRPLVDGRWSRADRDGGMGGLKFAGGNLGGDQGPAPCECDQAALLAVDCLIMRTGAEESGSTLKLGPKRSVGDLMLARWCCRAAGHTINAPLSFSRLLLGFPFFPPLPGNFLREICIRNRPLQVICRPSRAFRGLSNSGPSHPC